jgi:hypothetical protein
MDYEWLDAITAAWEQKQITGEEFTMLFELWRHLENERKGRLLTTAIRQKIVALVKTS